LTFTTTIVLAHTHSDFAGYALSYHEAESLWTMVSGECKALVQSAGKAWLRRFIEGKENRRPHAALIDVVLIGARAAFKGQELKLLLFFLSLFPEVTESTLFDWLNKDQYLWQQGDDKQLGDFLVSREWRETTKCLRWHWKTELKSAAWYAREILDFWDNVHFSRPNISKILFPSYSTANMINDVSMTTSPITSQTILFLAANPKGTGLLRLDQELRDIKEGLQRSQQRDLINLEQRSAVRPQDIQRAMLDLTPQIVHFSGHGAGEAGLVFEDEIGNIKLVDGNALVVQSGNPGAI
jgi:hypothetical protein